MNNSILTTCLKIGEHHNIQQNKIELRELEIPEKEFGDFIGHYLQRDHEVSLEEQKRIKNELKEIGEKNQKKGREIKSLLLEWIAYYFYRSQPGVLNVDLNTEKQKGEIDVLVETKDEIRLIECKVKPDNYDLVKEIKKLIKKAENKSGQMGKPYSIEFWFWHPPSESNQKIIREYALKPIILKEKMGVLLFNKMQELCK